MTIQFHKYQGTGNDFIMIDNRKMHFSGTAEVIAQLCHRRFGIGADGLILLQHSDTADYRMVYYNADGRESSMCGNGGRCLVRFAHSLAAGGVSGVFEATDGPHPFTILENGAVKLKMKDVSDVDTAGDVCVLDTGSPHYVRFEAAPGDLAELAIVEEARKVRYSDRYRAEGINVNFAVAAAEGVFMRTYERGVEDETLSCGTGTVAVALAAALRNPALTSPVEINTPGGKLKVHYHRKARGFSDIWLEGPAEKVFEGDFQL